MKYDKTMRILLGLVCLGLAAWVLLQGLFNIIPIDLKIWPLLFTILFGYLMVKELLKKSITGTIIFGTLTLLTVNWAYHLIAISNGKIILTALLLAVGLNLLFKPKKQRIQVVYFNKKNQDEGGHVFSSSTRYINKKDYESDRLEVAFGSSTIYFDNADMLGDVAEFDIDAVFSKVVLYIPNNWKVNVTFSDHVFSNVKTPAVMANATKILNLTGDLVFSNVEIRYI